MSTAFGLALLIALPHTGPDTVRIRAVAAAPAPDRLADTVSWGFPQIVVETGQGRASIWLLTVADSVYLVAAIPDSTPYWGDDLVVSIDTDGDRANTPQHDDFQWYLRRMLDSSVVLRGRAGRWDPPPGPLPLDAVDEILLMMAWFRSHPEALRRTSPLAQWV